MVGSAVIVEARARRERIVVIEGIFLGRCWLD